MWTKIIFATLFFCGLAAAQSYPSYSCPPGWSYLAWDDSCSAVWPRLYIGQNITYNATRALELSVPLNFKRATELCEQQRATLPVIRDLTTQLTFYKNLIGLTSGRSFWLNVWSNASLKDFDATTQSTWITTDRRPVGFVFDWDTVRGMPRSYDRCVAMHMKGLNLYTHGGNEKMIGTDCGATHHVICTKKRVPAGIGAVNGGEPRRMEFVWNTTSLVLTFAGSRIPSGTLLTFQTGDDATSNPTQYRQATQCTKVTNITGASTPFPLTLTSTSNSSVDPLFAAQFCGTNSTTCDFATITVPKDWPFIRGAKYSLCFYVADLFATPSTSLDEYQHNLLGANMYIDVVQKYTSYQEDICESRKHVLETYYGGYNDASMPYRTSPYPFDAPVEDSKNLLLSHKTLNPPKGYEFLG